MAVNLGVAEGFIELDFSNLKTAAASACQQLEQIERQSKLTESEMLALQSAANGTGNAFQQAENKQKALSDQLNTAKKKVETYQTTIKGLNDIVINNGKALSETAKKIQELTQKQQKAKEQTDQLKTAYKAATKEHAEAVKKYGEESTQAQHAAQAQEKAKKAYENSCQALNRTENSLQQATAQQANLKQETSDCFAKMNEFSAKCNIAQADVNTLTQKLTIAESSMATWGGALQQAGTTLQNTGSKMSKAGGALTLGVTMPIAAAGTAVVKAAMDFETAFTGVTKTVDGTERQLADLRQGIIDMSEEIPSSTTEISAVAEAAGQLGIETPNILKFTRTMIDLGNTTNISAEQAATSLAQFVNVTGMSQQDFDRLGSTIVDLGNNFATSEAKIVDMGARLVGAGHQIGLSEPKILGLATALSSVGIEADAGGSAFSTLMSNMQLAVEQGGEDLQNFASVAGMSAQDFQTAFRTDAAGALTAFVQGLANCDQTGQSAISTLANMGITEIRQRDALLRAAGASETFTNAMETGSKAWDENIALTNEANKRYETTESKLKLAKNRIQNAAAAIGENLLPVVADLAEGVQGATGWLKKLDPQLVKNAAGFLGVAAAIGPVVKVTGSATKSIGGLVSGTGKLIGDLGKLSGAKTAAKAIGEIGTFSTKSVDGVSGLSKALFSLATPTGGIIAATGAVLGLVAAGISCKIQATQADQATKDLIQSSKDLRSEQNEALAQADQKRQSVISDAAANQILIDRLYELNDKENKSNGEKQTMIGLVDQLNERIPDLNLAIDEQTGKLSKQRDEVIKYNDEYKRKLLIEASQEKLTTIAKNQIDMQEKLAELTQKRADKQQELTSKQEEYNKKLEYALANGISNPYQYAEGALNEAKAAEDAIKKLDDEISESQNTLKDYDNKWNETTSYIEQATNATSDAAASVRQNFARLGFEVSDGFVNAIAAASPEVQQGVTDLFGKIKLGTQANGGEIRQLFSDLGVSVSDELCLSLAGKSPEVQAGTIDLLAQLKSGVNLETADIKTLFSNLGITASDGLVNSLKNVEPNVQTQAIHLLSQLQTAEDIKRPEILADLYMLGVDVDTNLSQGLNSNIQVIRDSATGAITALKDAAGNQITNITPQFAQMLANMGIIGRDEMEAAVSSSNINSPGVDNIDAPSWVAEQLKNMQTQVNKSGGLGIKATANIDGWTVNGKKLPADFIGPVQWMADGGFTNGISIAGEAGTEAVIPLSAGKRTRAVSLLDQTANKLGYSVSPAQDDTTRNVVYDISASRFISEKIGDSQNRAATVVGIDYNLLAEKLAEKLRKSPVQVNFEVQEGDVIVDGEKLGRKIAPVISRKLHNNSLV